MPRWIYNLGPRSPPCTPTPRSRARVDSSKYTCPRPISYITHHSQHISLGIVKADAGAIRGEIDKRKAELVNHMGAMGAHM